ncbi:MAG TPA: BrnT family toxin [Anaerolineae bacterium]|nr:BrnT family toxin [Anaerolineae bacterium]
MDYYFEWDARKAATNERKHSVGFDEARTVFYDPLARIFDDVDHSSAEHREIIIGRSALNRLLIVSFIERQKAIRLISARIATRFERQDYEENISR